MHLDYRLSEDWDENPADLAAAEETDLRYYAAPGDIILRARIRRTLAPDGAGFP